MFTPRHPRTRPKLSDVEEAQAKIDGLEKMINDAANGAKRRFIRAAQ